MSEQGLEMHWEKISHLCWRMMQAHGAKKAKLKHFNPLMDGGSTTPGEMKAWQEELDLPEEQDNETIMARYEEYKNAKCE